jgi:hypothetical protein
VADNKRYGTMVIPEYQRSNVLKTYMKNMRTGISSADPAVEDVVLISKEGMRRVTRSLAKTDKVMLLRD